MIFREDSWALIVVRVWVCLMVSHCMYIATIHGSPGTENPGPGTEIGVFGHVWRYFYRIGTGDCDFLSIGLELVLVLVDCDFLSTGLYRSRGLIILIIIYV